MQHIITVKQSAYILIKLINYDETKKGPRLIYSRLRAKENLKLSNDGLRQKQASGSSPQMKDLRQGFHRVMQLSISRY